MAKKRKTRQEKIIADLRRKLAVTKKAKQEVGSEKLEIPKISHVAPRAAGIASGDARQYPASSIPFPTSYLKRDLTKTLGLAILAISLELVIYFFLG